MRPSWRRYFGAALIRPAAGCRVPVTRTSSIPFATPSCHQPASRISGATRPEFHFYFTAEHLRVLQLGPGRLPRMGVIGANPASGRSSARFFGRYRGLSRPNTDIAETSKVTHLGTGVCIAPARRMLCFAVGEEQSRATVTIRRTSNGTSMSRLSRRSRSSAAGHSSHRRLSGAGS